MDKEVNSQLYGWFLKLFFVVYLTFLSKVRKIYFQHTIKPQTSIDELVQSTIWRYESAQYFAYIIQTKNGIRNVWKTAV